MHQYRRQQAAGACRAASRYIIASETVGCNDCPQPSTSKSRTAGQGRAQLRNTKTSDAKGASAPREQRGTGRRIRIDVGNAGRAEVHHRSPSASPLGSGWHRMGRSLAPRELRRQRVLAPGLRRGNGWSASNLLRRSARHAAPERNSRVCRSAASVTLPTDRCLEPSHPAPWFSVARGLSEWGRHIGSAASDGRQ